MRGIKKRKENLKDRIIEKTEGLCAVCGKKLEYGKVTIEHFIPKYHGGTDDVRNLLPLCKNCNKSKKIEDDIDQEIKELLKGK